MNAASAKIHQLLVEASDLSQRTTGELAMELHRRMGKITALRITAKGALRLCLFGELGVNLRDLLTPGQDEALKDRIEAALVGKPSGHRLHENNSGDTRQLAQFGG